MEDNKKFIYYIDVNFLPLKKPFNRNNCDTMPVWDVTNTYKNSDGLYEFEIFAKEEKATSSASDENNSMDQCYICDTPVQTAYMQTHFTGDKHRTCAAILHVALRRATEHAQSVPLACTGSVTQPVPLVHSPGDPTYFCDHCSLAVKLKNKNSHEKTKEHQVSVIHDRLLNGLLITYMDKRKIVADSRYKAQVLDASRDSNFKDVNLKADEATYDPDITDESYNVNHVYVKQSDLKEKNDDETIVFSGECQENNYDVDQASDLILVGETVDVCDENWDSRSSKSLPNQAKDNQDPIPYNEQEAKEIRTMTSSTVIVPTNNYHGFVNTWAAWGEAGNFNCLLCQKVAITDTEAHTQEPRHIELISIPVLDINCIRQINEVWHHCIICNKMVQNKEKHVSSHLHKNKLFPLELTRKQLEFQKKAEKMWYCDTCNCSTAMTNKDQHLNSARHTMTFSRKNNSSDPDTTKNCILHHHLKKLRGEILCIICNVFVNDDAIDAHTKSDIHYINYKRFLVRNQMTVVDKDFKVNFNCHACNLKGKNMYEIDHVKSEIHKNNVLVYKPESTAPVNVNLIEDIDFLDFTTVQLLYLLESSEEPKKVRCMVCKVDIKSKSAKIKKHMTKHCHQFNLNALLDVNKMKNKLDGTYFCEICCITIEFTKEIDHINSYAHKRNERKIPLSLRERGDDINRAAVSAADNPNSKVNVLDCNTVKNLATIPTKMDIKTNEHISKTLKPKESFKFKQLLQMNKLRSTENGEYFCVICTVQVQSVLEHIQSESHLYKLTENTDEKNKTISQYFCEACQTHVHNIFYIIDIHNRSEQHKMNLKTLQKSNENKIERDISNFEYMLEPTNNRSSIQCKVCQFALDNTEGLINRHMKTSKHEKSLNVLFTKNKLQIQFTGKYLCEFCNVNIELVETLNHIDSEKHKQNYYDAKDTVSKQMEKHNDITKFTKSNTEQQTYPSTCKNEGRHHFEKNHPPKEKPKFTDYVKTNVITNKGNTQGFATILTVNNKTFEKHALNSEKKKFENSNDKLKNSEVNDGFDETKGSFQASSITGNSEVKKPSKLYNINNYLKAVPSKPSEVICKICNTVIPKTDINIQDHLKGRRHNFNYEKFLSSYKLNTVEDKSPSDINITATNIRKNAKSNSNTTAALLKGLPIFKYDEGLLLCRCCNTEVTYTEQDINTHVSDWKHKFKSSSMLAENGLRVDRDKIYCDVCEVYVPNLNGIIHIDSISHKTKVSVKSSEKVEGAEINESVNCENNDTADNNDQMTLKDTNFPKANDEDTREVKAVLCDVCKVCVLNMPAHLEGEQHKSIVKPKIEGKYHSCEVCNTKVDNDGLKKHENGAAHKKNLEAILLKNRIISRDGNVMFCDLCDLFLTAVSLMKHVKGENHKENYRYLGSNRFL